MQIYWDESLVGPWCLRAVRLSIKSPPEKPPVGNSRQAGAPPEARLIQCRLPTLPVEGGECSRYEPTCEVEFRRYERPTRRDQSSQEHPTGSGRKVRTESAD